MLGPVTSWAGATFSSLMPLRYEGGLWWVRARLASDVDAPGLSLDPIRELISSSGIDFDIEQASGIRGAFSPMARLTLRNLDPSCDDIGFDPILHSDSEVSLEPRWLSHFRRAAYRRSREGRTAD